MFTMEESEQLLGSRQDNCGAYGGSASPMEDNYEQLVGSNRYRQRNRRASSYVPGLSSIDVVQRQRYLQFADRSVGDPGGDPWWQLQSGLLSGEYSRQEPRSKESIQESIDFHLEMLSSVKAQPWPMRKKIEAAVQAKEFLHWQMQQLGKADNFAYRQQQNLKRVRKKADNAMISWKIWGESIKKVEAYFGSGVASYFTFIRTLLWLNIPTGILLFCFLSIPELAVHAPEPVLIGQDGLGILNNTFLFYGKYSKQEGVYNMALAYFLTVVIVFLMFFILIVRRMMTRYTKSRKTDTKEEYVFSWQLFTQWDHSITAAQGVKEKKSTIKTNFKEQVRELKEAKRRQERNKYTVFLGRLLSNILVLGILAGSVALIVFVVQNKDGWFLSLPVGTEVLQAYVLPFIMAALKLIVPMFFELLVKIEKWHPRVATEWTIVRTVCFYYASLIVLIIELYEHEISICHPHDENNSTKTNCSSQLNVTNCCWETVVGVEMVKLFVLDFILVVLSIIILVLIRAAVVKSTRIGKKIGYVQFSVSSSVLELCYGQAIVWLGLYFSPILPLAAAVKLFLFFYLRYVTVRFASSPPKVLFRASTAGSFYLGILLMTLFLAFLPVGYAIFELQPSACCGPFAGLGFPFEVLSLEIIKVVWLNTVLGYITSAGIVVPLLIVLVLLVLYYRVVAVSYKSVIGDLRMQLHYERSVGKKMVYAVAKGVAEGTSKIEEAPEIL